MTVIVFISSVIAVSALATLLRQRHRKPDNMHQSNRQASNIDAAAGSDHFDGVGGGT